MEIKVSDIVIVKEGDATSLKDLNTGELSSLVKYVKAVLAWKNSPGLWLEPKLIKGSSGYAYSFTKEEETGQVYNKDE